MSVTNFINDLASKGRDLPDIASKFLNNAQYGPWIRTGFWISGTTLALYTVNRILNIRALNHGTQASFDWSKEIVVITGGSGGIGGETVKRLAAGGTTVVILDLVPPTYPKGMKYILQVVILLR
jgi:3-oxoacyl-ACP reductase-like protein